MNHTRRRLILTLLLLVGLGGGITAWLAPKPDPIVGRWSGSPIALWHNDVSFKADGRIFWQRTIYHDNLTATVSDHYARTGRWEPLSDAFYFRPAPGEPIVSLQSGTTSIPRQPRLPAYRLWIENSEPFVVCLEDTTAWAESKPGTFDIVAHRNPGWLERLWRRLEALRQPPHRP